MSGFGDNWLEERDQFRSEKDGQRQARRMAMEDVAGGVRRSTTNTGSQASGAWGYSADGATAHVTSMMRRTTLDDTTTTTAVDGGETSNPGQVPDYLGLSSVRQRENMAFWERNKAYRVCIEIHESLKRQAAIEEAIRLANVRNQS